METNKTLPVKENSDVGKTKQTFLEKLKEKRWSFFKIMSSIITVLMLILAFISQYDAKKITESISTRYIGEDTDLHDKMNKEFETAEKSIVIIDDILAGGFFSTPQKFHKTITLLEEKSDKIPVTVIVYDSTYYRDEVLPKMFFKQKQESVSDDKLLSFSEKQKDSLLREIINKEKYKSFVEYDYSDDGRIKEYSNLQNLNVIKDKYFKVGEGEKAEAKKFDSITCKQFFDCLAEMIYDTERVLKERRGKKGEKGIEIIHIDFKQEHKMFCYLTDGEKAIFGIPDNNLATPVIIFRTADSKFLKIMEDAKEYYIKNKKAYKPVKKINEEKNNDL